MAPLNNGIGQGISNKPTTQVAPSRVKPLREIAKLLKSKLVGKFSRESLQAAKNQPLFFKFTLHFMQF